MTALPRPRPGIIGALLAVALMLIGAAFGIAVAIWLKWIPMSSEMAGFLGSLVGGGLGSALAVIGAVHIQKEEQRHKLVTLRRIAAADAELLVSTMRLLHHSAISLYQAYEREIDEKFRLDSLTHQIKLLKEAMEDMQAAAATAMRAAELGADIARLSGAMRLAIDASVKVCRECFEVYDDGFGAITAHGAVSATEGALSMAIRLSRTISSGEPIDGSSI